MRILIERKGQGCDTAGLRQQAPQPRTVTMATAGCQCRSGPAGTAHGRGRGH